MCKTFWELRERKREEKLGGGEKHYSVGGGSPEQNVAVLKVPRQCPLVLLVGMRLVCGINSNCNCNKSRNFFDTTRTA
jgi:hypothetical protein